MMDSEKHKEYTGVTNDVILENLEALANSGASINIRIPLIKGVNDDAKNIDQTIKYIAPLPGENRKINILPYHGIAAKKYEKLGGKYNEGLMAEPSEEEQMLIVEKFANSGLDAVLGG